MPGSAHSQKMSIYTMSSFLTTITSAVSSVKAADPVPPHFGRKAVTFFSTLQENHTYGEDGGRRWEDALHSTGCATCIAMEPFCAYRLPFLTEKKCHFQNGFQCLPHVLLFGRERQGNFPLPILYDCITTTTTFWDMLKIRTQLSFLQEIHKVVLLVNNHEKYFFAWYSHWSLLFVSHLFQISL